MIDFDTWWRKIAQEGTKFSTEHMLARAAFTAGKGIWEATVERNGEHHLVVPTIERKGEFEDFAWFLKYKRGYIIVRVDFATRTIVYREGEKCTCCQHAAGYKHCYEDNKFGPDR